MPQLPWNAIPFRGVKIAGQSIISRCSALEARLSGVRRGVDEQLGERLATLDRLIDEADREIVRLRACLRETTTIPSAAKSQSGSRKMPWNWLSQAFTSGPDIEFSPVRDTSRVAGDTMTVQQLEMIRDLRKAGHSVEAIAELIHRPAAVIEHLLSDNEPPSQFAKAA